MDVKLFTQRMSNNAQTIKSLVDHCDDEQARWRPDAHSWSILEVIHHLYDEEKEDFRVRLKITLEQKEQKWPPIDPANWVQTRDYNQQNLAHILAGFLQERVRSIDWLYTLQNPDWTAVYQAPWGSISAAELFASWIAHDLLHTRQLVELHWAYTQRLLQPHSTAYAGTW